MTKQLHTFKGFNLFLQDDFDLPVKVIHGNIGKWVITMMYAHKCTVISKLVSCIPRQYTDFDRNFEITERVQVILDNLSVFNMSMLAQLAHHT